MGCMGTLQAGMPPVEWPSSRLTWVNAHLAPLYALFDQPLTEMLTPIDQPLDKLTDLQADEMYGSSSLVCYADTSLVPAKI